MKIVIGKAPPVLGPAAAGCSASRNNPVFPAQPWDSENKGEGRKRTEPEPEICGAGLLRAEATRLTVSESMETGRSRVCSGHCPDRDTVGQPLREKHPRRASEATMGSGADGAGVPRRRARGFAELKVDGGAALLPGGG